MVTMPKKYFESICSDPLKKSSLDVIATPSLSRGKQSQIPPCPPLSKGGKGGFHGIATALGFLAFLLLCFSPATAHAWQSTPNVPPDSVLYRDLDKLVALGLVHPPIVGQRPYPRSEFARLTAEAVKKVESEGEIRADSLEEYVKKQDRAKQIDIVLNRLKSEFEEELIDQGLLEGKSHAIEGHPFESFKLEFTYLNSPDVAFPVDNGVGTVNAVENPLRDDRLGRHTDDGFQNAIETIHRFSLSKYFSVYASPRFEVNIPRVNGDMRGKAYVQNLYAIFQPDDYFALEFGRDSIVWGAGEHGDLMVTDNARPLDLIKITNPKPARLPWIFKYLGQWKYTLFGANLGPENARKYAWLAGWKFSLLPARYVELGFSHAVMMGGEGAPNLSALDVIGEFAGFRPAGSDPDSPNKTNHMMEAELLVRIPQLRGAQLYGVITNEDKRDSVKRFLKDGSGYVAGLYLPALFSSGSTDFRLEFEHTPALIYRHGLYSDGWTLNRKLIGSSLGSDGERIRAVIGQTVSSKLDLRFEAAWDHRRSDLKTTTTDPDGSLGDVITVEHRPAEDRYRFLLDGMFRTKKHINIGATVGVERVKNIAFNSGVDRTNYLLALSLTFDFDNYFRFVH